MSAEEGDEEEKELDKDSIAEEAKDKNKSSRIVKREEPKIQGTREETAEKHSTKRKREDREEGQRK